jgi:hypothetical protein
MSLEPTTRIKAIERSAQLTRKSFAYLRKNYGYLTKDPRFFWMKTAARFEIARARSQRAQRGTTPAVLSTDSLETDVGIDEVVHALESEGYFVGVRLKADVVHELREQCAKSVCYGDRRPDLPFRIDERATLEHKLERRLRVASYFESQNDWPVFRRLRDDPWLAIVARAYLGRDPLYLRSEISWTFAHPRTHAEKIADAHVFHCDINDFRTLKMFFYLADVGPQNGPHEYIKRHPRGRKLVHQLMGQRVASLPEGELQRVYGEDRVVSIQGPAGLGFLGDPYTFHRGNAPERDSRLLLQIELGARRYRTWYFDV